MYKKISPNIMLELISKIKEFKNNFIKNNYKLKGGINQWIYMNLVQI